MLSSFRLWYTWISHQHLVLLQLIVHNYWLFIGVNSSRLAKEHNCLLKEHVAVEELFLTVGFSTFSMLLHAFSHPQCPFPFAIFSHEYLFRLGCKHENYWQVLLGNLLNTMAIGPSLPNFRNSKLTRSWLSTQENNSLKAVTSCIQVHLQ